MPDFWHAFEEGEDQVIGDKPANTGKLGSLQRKLYVKAKVERQHQVPSRGPDRSIQRSESASPSADSVDVKPAGEPDAGNRHVRFDERREETGRSRMAQATAPLFNSTHGRVLRNCYAASRPSQAFK